MVLPDKIRTSLLRRTFFFKTIDRPTTRNTITPLKENINPVLKYPVFVKTSKI
jgi:hypothetical protein